MKQQPKIIDGDGHIFEDGDAIARHFPYSAAGGRLRSGVFPLNSHIQYSLTRTPPGAFATNSEGRFQNPGPEGWIEFMDQVGFDYAVLFPTAGPTHRPHRRPRLRLRRGPCLQRLAGRNLSAARFTFQRHRLAADARCRRRVGGIAARSSRIGHVRRAVPGHWSAFKSRRQALLAGVRGSGSAGLSRRRSRRRPLGSRHGHNERFHRRQCHWSSDVAGDRFGGDGVQQSVRALPRPARGLSRGRSALVSHGSRTFFSIL